MRKIYFLLVMVLASVSVMAQPWTYDFGTGTGSFTSSTASTSFLPTPPAGTARVRVGTNPGSIVMANPGLATLGTNTELQISSNTGSTSTTKFSIHDYTASKTGYVKFPIAIAGGTNGFYKFSLGDGATFSDNNAIATNQIFAGIEWSLGSSNSITYRVLNASTYVTTGIINATTLFTQSTTTIYQIEIYYNNTTTATNYVRSGTSYSIASGTWDLWVDGIIVGNDLARGGIANDVNIDSYAFNHQNSSSSPGTIYLDDIEYSNTLPNIPTPTTTSISPSSATEGTGGFTLTVNGTNFVNGVSNVRWNGVNKTTTFVNSTQLTAAIDAADIATAGSATVTVLNTGNPTESNNQTFTINPAAAPSKLVITSVSPASPTVNSPFSVTVQSQDNLNIPQNVGSNVTVNLSRTAGTGTLGGTLSGTINAGNNSVTFTGLTYDVAESGVELTASDGASVLTSGTTTFTVQQAASQLAFVGVPSSGTLGVNLSSFTVEARRPDNSVDNTYTGNITISKVSGPGTLSGTTTVAAVAGVATFSGLQFDLVGSYTISASASGLTSTTSGSINITPLVSAIYQHDFGTTTISAHPYTVAPTVFAANLSSSSWTNGASSWTNFTGSSGQAIANSSISGSNPWTLTFNVAAGYAVSITSFNFWRQSSQSTNNWSMTINGISVGSGSIPTSGAAIGTTNVANQVSNLTGTVTVVLTFGGTLTGSMRIDDFILNGYVLPIPTISSFTPTNGYTASTVVITGTNFTGATSVTFGGTNAASFTVDNATQITATVGAGSTGVISITTPNGTGSSVGTFTYNGYISDISGNWNTGSSWLGGGVPPIGSNVTLKPGNTITMTANESVNDITIGTGATLDLNGNTLSVSGDYSNSGNLSTNLGTVDFNRTTGTQTLISGGTGVGKTFYNLTHSGTGALQLATNNLRIINNFDNSAGTFNNGSFAITVGNNFSSAGTYTPGTGVLTFDGSGNQNWSGAAANNYGDVVINKSSGDVILGNNITVNNLTLTNGKAVLGSNNLVVSSAVTGGSSASYVQTNGTGTFTVNNITTGKSLPVGNAAYNPLLIENGSGHNWSARVIDGLTASPGYNTDKAVLLQWDITPSVNPPAGGADITFQFDQSTQVGPLFNTATSVQAWRNPLDAGWVTAGSPTAVTVVNGTTSTIKVTGLSGFSKYALSNIDGPLPVTLISFSGYKDGSRNQLSWTTGTEINNRGFDVQRSADGINYTSIGFVNSLATGGNSNDQLSYRFTDNTPAGVKQYYRLRQEDLDGRSKLSNIVMINGARPTMIALKGIYPNPASTTAAMIIDAPVAAKLTVLLTDMAGRNLVQQIVNVSEGSNTVALNIASLQSGTYLVRVISETGEMLTGKLVKQ
jgi:hypothetical protein